MNFHKKDQYQPSSIMTLSSAELNYFQELCSIFPNIDHSYIKNAIIQYKDWNKIVGALLQPELNLMPVQQMQTSSKSEDPKKTFFEFANKPNNVSEKIGISEKPTKYEDLPCRLYLPRSIIDVPLDFENFGNFSTF